VGENIALDLPYPKIEKTLPKYLTIDEYNRILRYFYENAINSIGLRNFVLTMIFGILGLRLDSVISLNVDDIDLETRLICFTDKGKKERMLIVPRILCIVLSQYLELHDKKQGPLFLSIRNKRVSQRTLQDIFRQAGPFCFW